MNRGFTFREQVGPAAHGQTVLAYLAEAYDHGSVAEWQERIELGEILISDRRVRPDDRLRRGDWLVWNRPPWEEPEVPLSFELLHEDEDILAVAKPSGLPTMPAGGFFEHTLLTLVQRSFPDATPMHRLGRGTSGIVLFGRTATARSALQEAWRTHRVRKRYRALVTGTPPPSLTIEQRIGLVDHPKLGRLFAASADGKAAMSHVTLVEPRGSNALVDVVIETGRPHQIRIHLASVGHPLVGDPLYEAGGGARVDAVPGDLGYWLHAASLSFAHPRTDAPLTIECRPPDELRAATDPA